MSSNRVIKLKLLTQTELVKVETSARTLAEFKLEPIVKELSIDWSSAKLIDRASKATFDLDESVLPAIDSLMFVTPTKTKSGALDYREAKAEVKKYKDNGGIVPFNYTTAGTSTLNEFLDSIGKSTSCNCKSASTSSVKAQVINLIQDNWVEVIDSEELGDLIETSELVDNTTLEDLDDEANALKGRI